MWQKRIHYLNKFGIFWINHQESTYFRGGYFSRDMHTESIRIGKQLIDMKGYSELMALVGNDVNFDSVIYQHVFSEIFPIIELIYCIPKKSNLSNKVWLPNNIITSYLLNNYKNISNVCPRFCTILQLVFQLTASCCNLFCSVTLKKIKSFLLSNEGKKDKFLNAVKKSKSLNLGNVKIAYFPQEGVLYSNLYLKDHFYSKNKKSPFYFKKIIHFEWNKSVTLPYKSKKYYKSNEIVNLLWDSIKVNLKIPIFNQLRLASVALRLGFSDLDFELFTSYSRFFWLFDVSILRLSMMPNLKIVLVGYDVLFPQILSSACKKKGIKTIANQERFHSPWVFYPMYFDYYFVMGSASYNYLKKNAPTPMIFYKCGPVRLKNYEIAKVPEVIKNIREKYKWIVLALDFHSVPDWYSNGRSFNTSWRKNMVFYDHLLQLSNDFPEAFFLLKSKDTNYISIPYFKRLIDKFRERHNIMILDNFEIWTPFVSVKSCDIGLARYTSLADEMLAFNKPVIIDDYDGIPSEYLRKAYLNHTDYLVAQNYKNIKDKLTRFFKNPQDYNSSLNPLRKKIFTIPSKPIDKYLENKLMKIWSEH